MIKMLDSGEALQNDDIARLEATLGRPLPEQYRAFLLAHNGGRPTPDLVDIEGAHFKGSDIHTFHGIHAADDVNDLFWNLETLEGCKAAQLLPIAYDSFGQIFMLVLSEKNYGHVNYFDSGEVPPRPYLVANDFNEFINKIREPTPDELAPDEGDNDQDP